MRTMRGQIILIVCLVAFVAGWMWVSSIIWPTPPPKPKPEAYVALAGKASVADGALAGMEPNPSALLLGSMAEVAASLPKPSQEDVIILAGGMASGTDPVRKLRLDGIPKVPEPPKIEPEKPYGRLIAIGHGSNPYYLQALLNTRGGSVQQIVLTKFDEASAEGMLVKQNGVPETLHLVPGVRVPFMPSIRAQSELKLPVLSEGPYPRNKFEAEMSPPSFQIFHYEKPNDERPLAELGEREWRLVKEDCNQDGDVQTIVFETDLEEPYNLRLTKTFTLKRKEYHLGLKVDIKRLDGKQGANQFRYQLTGANGLPIEGEWYTSTYRQAIVGFVDNRGNTSRSIEDARAVRETEGSDRQTRSEKTAISYAAVAVQFFASAIAVDDDQEKRNFIEFVRATPVGPVPFIRENPKDVKHFDFLSDLTVRAISESFDPDNVSHKYLLYHGPVKVRLLRQMPADKAVDDALVDRYLDKIHLDTLTDAPMPNVLGRFANAIYWSDIVIAFTNIIHSLLYQLHEVIPSLGVCVIVLTLIVRILLFPLSRRQAHNAQVMQAKMAKFQPELKKLQEKYGDDFQRMNQEKMRLYKEHGINPFAAMGGCLLLLLQMPVMMGLYYALQESVFFRLDPFLWAPNLAAPDMLIYWSESIWYISTPIDLGQFYYLGPYFNVLPFVAVSLMLYQQVKMMPKSDDPQVQQQQKMMKFMMIFMGFMFYKVAAGLCFYFITSTLWGILERNLKPPPVKPEELEDAPARPGPDVNGKKVDENRPLGWWGRKKKNWKEKWGEILEQAQKQQEYRRQQGPAAPADRDKGKKKKKKR
jgi:YidC/Oxa1 family membrane protein insertase